MTLERNMWNQYAISSLERCSELLASSLSFHEKIETFAKFLRNADSNTDRSLLGRAMECLVHLQFKHRKDRKQGIIVTEDEYWAWSISLMKQVING